MKFTTSLVASLLACVAVARPRASEEGLFSHHPYQNLLIFPINEWCAESVLKSTLTRALR